MLSPSYTTPAQVQPSRCTICGSVRSATVAGATAFQVYAVWGPAKALKPSRKLPHRQHRLIVGFNERGRQEVAVRLPGCWIIFIVGEVILAALRDPAFRWSAPRSARVIEARGQPKSGVGVRTPPRIRCVCLGRKSSLFCTKTLASGCRLARHALPSGSSQLCNSFAGFSGHARPHPLEGLPARLLNMLSRPGLLSAKIAPRHLSLSPASANQSRRRHQHQWLIPKNASPKRP